MSVDRRTFLKSSAGLAAAAIGVVPAIARGDQDQPQQRRYRLSLKWGMIAGGASILDKFEIVKRCGFDGIEIDSPSNLNLDEIKEASKRTGIVVEGVVDSVHWNQPLSSPDPAVRAKGVEGLQTALRDAAKVKATTVLLVPAVVNAGVSYADAYARSQDEIRKVLPLARELGVRIAIENVWNHFLLSPLEAARYTDELDPNLVGWHFDIGNIVNYGWPEHWIRTLGEGGKRIWKLDVKEFSRKKRNDEGLWKGFDCEIGEGDVDWKAVREALAAIEYRDAVGDGGGGWAAAEVGGGDEKRLKDICDRMDRCLNVMD